MFDVYEQIKLIVARLMVQSRPFAFCTVVGYDDKTHTAQVQVQPDGLTYPGIPILLPWRGFKMPHGAGLQGACLLIAGVPQLLLGVTYTTGTPLPTVGMAIEESIHVAGDLRVSGGLYLGVAPELPAAISTYTYAMIVVSERATGLTNARPARTYQCLPSADGSLHWVQICAAP